MDLEQIVKRYRLGYSLDRAETDALIALAEEEIERRKAPKPDKFRAVKAK